ncbi:cytochrome c oxidase subunit 4 isoform 2, mitochondrial isoform X2 [Octodon degus]|uniref:Cytochrome c oxidase subunit 4 n=1 Tax=Octodon degus TaxID=10160 RepID=A0A6P6EF96_OCTDE|nr:cytochrome c oxidase subunit 4 isoform 2, mitochondrial isoform X2 [Octodon degus]
MGCPLLLSSYEMLSRAAWSLVLRRGPGMRGTHSPGGAAGGQAKMPPYTNHHAQRYYPMPDDPFCTDLSAEQRILKEKEKSSWTQLSHAEKVALYRIQFGETFAEMNRRSNEWKTVTGCVFFFMGITALLVWWLRVHGEWLCLACSLGHFLLATLFRESSRDLRGVFKSLQKGGEWKAERNCLGWSAGCVPPRGSVSSSVQWE